MKRFFCALGVIAVLVALVILPVRAATTLLGSLITVNNTTSNSTAVAIGSFTVPPQQLLVQNGGVVTGTNTFTANFQISLDQANWVTIKSYNPTVTNAATDSVTVPATNQTIYFRFQAVTTTNVQVGATLQ